MRESINGTEIHYEIAGAGGSKVLLLHGWGCDRSLMQPVANHLQDQFSILIPDFPGHGESGRPPEPWGVPEFAACLLNLLKEADFIPCDVIAHSFGCRVAAWLAAENPDLFTRMILTGAAGLRPRQSEEARKRSQQYRRLRGYCETIRKIPGMKNAAAGLEEKLRQKYGSRDYNALDEEMRKTFVMVINEDLRPLLPQIKASTLLIWGEKDQDTPLWMGQIMEKEIPDEGLVVFENDDHFAYLRQWPRFVAVVRAFLT